MPKLGARKVGMLIPYTENEDEVTDCFQHGADLAVIIHRKKEKPAAKAFLERISKEYRIKATAKAVDEGDLFSDAAKVFKAIDKKASHKKNNFHAVLTSGKTAAAVMYAAYVHPKIRIVFADDGRLVSAPVTAPDADGGFSDRVARLGSAEPEKGSIVAPSSVSGFGNTVKVEEPSRITLVEKVYSNSSGASVLATDPFFLLGAYLNRSAVAVYPAGGAFKALPMVKRDALSDEGQETVLGFVKANSGPVNDPMGTIAKETGLPEFKVGRHLKALSDLGFLTVDGRTDTVVLSPLGKLYLK
ncbi:MAG: hypothetical protein QF415_14115 [Candidatus Undinarchaeales archaeon]|nr:hypothetical protein [Candidatus Undinarchaeales archaeon]MDP7493893.1 hypothetical protein [Candidatus Undinarchaeales archaeon]